jgi:hypothetical protein
MVPISAIAQLCAPPADSCTVAPPMLTLPATAGTSLSPIVLVLA